jgi:phosphoglycerol transferase MdoB-like AlkP superfamily enzyme
MDKKQIITVWVIGILLGIELIGFMLLAYFATFEDFITRFVHTLRILSPIFLWLYAAFVILIMIGRGQEFTRKTWISYWAETLHFFLVSFLFTAAALAVCSLAATLLVSCCNWIAAKLGLGETMETLREWVRASFY